MISNFYRVYSCHCLTDDYSPLLKTFNVRKNGGFLANYLWNETANNDGIKSLALMDEEYHNARTYIIIDNDTQELVCYFSLKAGFLTTKEHHRLLSHDFESVPGVEISNFAVNENYIKKHPDRKGIGSNIFKYFILPNARSAQSIIGLEEVGNLIFALNTDNQAKELMEGRRRYREQLATSYAAGKIASSKEYIGIISEKDALIAEKDALIQKYKEKYGDI